MKLPIALAVVLGSFDLAAAGDREAEILLIDATPASAGAAGERCTRAIAKRLGAEDANVTRRTAAAVVARLGPNPPASILAWTEPRLAPLRQRAADATYDAIIVMDCRPDQRVLDLVVDPPAPGLVSFRLRALTLDAKVLDWIIDDAVAHAWAGFAP